VAAANNFCFTLTADQQQTIGFYYGSQLATIANPITSGF
jgi:hypothetical protein